MKTKKDVTIAYELLSEEIEKLQDSGRLVNALSAIALGQVREVLCWVLEHKHETNFGEMIEGLKKAGIVELAEGWEGQGGLNKCQPQ